MQCVSVAGLACGELAECVDATTGAVVNGMDHCPNTSPMTCAPACVAGWNDTAPAGSDAFCLGSGVDMYMIGFQSVVHGRDDGAPLACLNLLFEAWTLDTRAKFWGGVVAVVAAGVVAEAMTAARRARAGRPRSRTRPRPRARARRCAARARPRGARAVAQAALLGLHVCQLSLGYLLMLAAMTSRRAARRSSSASGSTGHLAFNLGAAPTASIDPCCAHKGGDDALLRASGDSARRRHGRRGRGARARRPSINAGAGRVPSRAGSSRCASTA